MNCIIFSEQSQSKLTAICVCTSQEVNSKQQNEWVNHYDFVALHSMLIIFLKGYCVLVRVEIIHKSKFLPGTVEKNSSTIYKVLRQESNPRLCDAGALL